jgi:hypothetical protein
MRNRRTVLKGGRLKWNGYYWHSGELEGQVGNYVWIVRPLDYSATTIRIEDSARNRLADATRGEKHN